MKSIMRQIFCLLIVLVWPAVAFGQYKHVVGYFTSWGVYDRDFHVKNLVTSGSASKLSAIIYTFADIDDDELICKPHDTYADWEKHYSEANSVDGVSDSWEPTSLRGSFNQLRKLKKMYPDLKVLMAIGGWTLSKNFPAAAQPENRKKFVESCIDLYIRGNFSNNFKGYSGIFDGIDIDWEFPGEADTNNFIDLLAEFRRQLNDEREGLLLTAALPPAETYSQFIDIENIHTYLDWLGLMAYDYHGAWGDTTNFQSALYPADGDPARDNQLTVSETVSRYIIGGAPSDKIVVGVPFYGRGWAGVSNNNNGLWQPGTGPAPGRYEDGHMEYKHLGDLGYPRFWNEQAQAAWLYNSEENIFWTYDDPQVMTAKAQFVRDNNLGGIMIWELSGDTDDGTLISNISQEFNYSMIPIIGWILILLLQ